MKIPMPSQETSFHFCLWCHALQVDSSKWPSVRGPSHRCSARMSMSPLASCAGWLPIFLPNLRHHCFNGSSVSSDGCVALSLLSIGLVSINPSLSLHLPVSPHLVSLTFLGYLFLLRSVNTCEPVVSIPSNHEIKTVWRPIDCLLNYTIVINCLLQRSCSLVCSVVKCSTFGGCSTHFADENIREVVAV